MTFDGVFTYKMVNELIPLLETGKVTKIHQPYDQELILTIRKQKNNYKLLLSTHAQYARCQLTEIPYNNPEKPPTFCTTLRKHLEGAILQKITQYENDRIIHFTFTKRNELGDVDPYVLILEMMGKHSALVLINHHSGIILDSIKHVGSSQNAYRTLLPGVVYTSPPEQNKLNPFTAKDTEVFHILSATTQITPQYLQTYFQGISRLTAKEIVYRLSQAPQDKLKVWHQFWQAIKTKHQPTLTQCDQKTYYTPIPYQSLCGTHQSFTSYSELLDYYYHKTVEQERVNQRLNNIERTLKHKYQKNEGKIKKLTALLYDAQHADILRIQGELLTTYLHLVKKGDSSVTLPNYYDQEQPITIKLNPSLTPNQNAQKYFQKYQKLKKGIQNTKEQLTITQQENDYLTQLLAQLQYLGPTELDALQQELVISGYLKQPKKQKKQQQVSKPYVFTLPDQTRILVGKNNIQNDQLTFKTAKKSDIWLHAKDIPGSHVILQTDHPTEEHLYIASLLAAYYSKYRYSAHVPVDYTEVKYVKKQKGAPPGLVTYTQQKTRFVTPEQDDVKNILTYLQ